MGDADDSYDFTQPDAVRHRAAQGLRPGDGQPVQGRHRAGRDAAAAPLPRHPGALLHRPAVLPLQDRRLQLRPARLPARQRDRPRPAGHRHGVRQRDDREGHPRASRRSPRCRPRSPRTAAAARRTCAPGATAGATCGSCCCSARAGCSCYPGLVLLIVGLGLGAAVATGPLTIGGVSLDVDTLVACGAAVDIGFQAILFWLFTQVYAGAEGFLPTEPKVQRLLGKLSLERGLLIGAAVGVAGLVGLIFSLTYWQGHAFGHLNYEHALRLMVPSVTALVLSCQLILGTFFLSILGIKQTKPTSRSAPRRSSMSATTTPQPVGFSHVIRQSKAHPDRAGLALRQRPAAHRARLRLRAAERHVQPVPADGGQQGADGLGHRRARHPDPGPGGQGRRHRQGDRRPVQRRHRPGPRQPRT